jgi:hypothetical protein
LYGEQYQLVMIVLFIPANGAQILPLLRIGFL